MTSEEFIVLLKQQIKGLATSLVEVDYTNAISAAERDTGWPLPQSADFKIKWLLERSYRHLLHFLRMEGAAKFRFKQIYLDQRFEHYDRLIERLDLEFKEAQDEFAFEFAGVDATQIAGTKIDAGFAYEAQTGRDVTFYKDNFVIITPNENS